MDSAEWANTKTKANMKLQFCRIFIAVSNLVTALCAAEIAARKILVYNRNSFLFNKQKKIYCTQIFTENLFNRKIKYITVTNRNTLIFCLFLLFPWFVSVGLSVSFLFYTNEQQKIKIGCRSRAAVPKADENTYFNFG